MAAHQQLMLLHVNNKIHEVYTWFNRQHDLS